MSNTARLVRSALAALSIIISVTATAQFIFAQTAIAKEHKAKKAPHHH